MITVSKITIDNEVVDIAAIEANAHKMRAEAMAAFAHEVRTWFKNLNIGFAARSAH